MTGTGFQQTSTNQLRLNHMLGFEDRKNQSIHQKTSQYRSESQQTYDT